MSTACFILARGAQDVETRVVLRHYLPQKRRLTVDTSYYGRATTVRAGGGWQF